MRFGNRSIAFLLLGILTAVIFVLLRRRWQRDTGQQYCNLEQGRVLEWDLPSEPVNNEVKQTYVIEQTPAQLLKQSVRILCYINTIPKTHITKARHVHTTWARRCTDHIFMTSENSQELPFVNMNLSFPESRKHLWSKMRKILSYVYTLRDQYDYFIKADDDTYMLMENLRPVLSQVHPEDLIIMGYPFTHIIHSGHLSGGAGYILSRGTLRKLIENSIDKHPACPTYDQDLEDVKTSMCSYAIGAKMVHVVDRHTTYPFKWRSEAKNEYRFTWMNLPHQFSQINKKGYIQPIPVNKGVPFVRDERNVLSALLISDHYVSPNMMYLLEFTTYHLRPAGIVYEYDRMLMD